MIKIPRKIWQNISYCYPYRTRKNFHFRSEIRKFNSSSSEKKMEPTDDKKTPYKLSIGQDPLLSAILRSDVDTAQLILKSGNCKIEDLDRAICSQSGERYLSLAFKTRNFKIFNLILKFGADPNLEVNNQKFTILHQILENFSPIFDDIVKNLLSNLNLKVNAITYSHITPLHMACRLNNLKFLEILLARPDLDVNFADKEGQTAIHIAVESENYDVVAKLLKHKTIILDKKDHLNQNIFDIAFSHGKLRTLLNLLNDEQKQLFKSKIKYSMMIKFAELSNWFIKIPHNLHNLFTAENGNFPETSHIKPETTPDNRDKHYVLSKSCN